MCDLVKRLRAIHIITGVRASRDTLGTRPIERANQTVQEAADAIEALQAERDRLREENEDLHRQVPKFPDHMADVLSAKNEPLDTRIERVCVAMENLPACFRKYQWAADDRQCFGEKFVRTVVGDNGRGTGRQYIASTPQHIDGLAEYIAAANPDTVALILSELLRARVPLGDDI